VGAGAGAGAAQPTTTASSANAKTSNRILENFIVFSSFRFSDLFVWVSIAMGIHPGLDATILLPVYIPAMG
jgi:hypothetical protein